MKKTLLIIFSIIVFLFLKFNHLESFELMSSWYNISRLNNTEWLTIKNDYQNSNWIHNNAWKDYEKWVNKYNYSTSLHWAGGFNALSGTFPYWSYQLNAETNTWAQQLDNSYHSFNAFNDSKFEKFVWNDPYFGNYSYYFPSISTPSLLFQINFFSLKPSSSKSSKLESITVTPATFQLLEAGSTETLIVKGNYSDGSIRDLTKASTGTRYLSSDQGVATVDADGLITATGEGEVIITVTNGESSTTIHGEVNIFFNPFRALPNVPHISDSFQDKVPSGRCYGCHGPQDEQSRVPAGATTIHGDDSMTPREHHPMGTQAWLGNSPLGPDGVFKRAPGTPPEVLNHRLEITCTSCHDGLHGLGWYPNNPQQAKANLYLRWEFINSLEKDKTDFCLVCHSDKSESNLYGKHLVSADDSPNGRGGCMFCHFIHDGQNTDGTERGTMLTPDLDALMRVPPQNLAWADKWADQDIFDYEDMCFGCHSDSLIVKGPGSTGSQLVPPQSLESAELIVPGNIRFSHRFASPPFSETTLANIRVGGKFPLSDGWGLNTSANVSDDGTLNDYGVSPGLIYCGTCHNVHGNSTNRGSPYLRGNHSPYEPVGFCEECHTASGSSLFIDPLLNHPLGRGPTPQIFSWASTIDTWPPEFITGGSGEKGGITFTFAGEPPDSGRIICMTCHSAHAASTTYDGWPDYPHSSGGTTARGNHGNLLIMDNYRDTSGSDMCIRCHPEFSGLVNSPHDFSPDYRPNCQIGSKGVCSSCHVPHNAPSAIIRNEKPVLWARDLTSEETLFRQRVSPAYTLSDTLLCYDCHSKADDDPPAAAYGQFIPQDVAFGDGISGGEIGYYEDVSSEFEKIPPYGFKTGGHFIKSSLSEGIMTGDKLACSECHDPHRGWTRDKARNQAFIKEWLGGRLNEGFAASLNMAYKDLSHGPRNNTQSRQICITCHGFSYSTNGAPMTSVPFVSINPLWESTTPITSPPSTIFEHSDLGNYACTDCHGHDRITVFCIDCHAYPPTTVGDGWSGPGDTDENYPGGTGAHAVHVFTCGYDCSTCHEGCLHNADGPTVVNPRFDRSKVSVNFNTLFSFSRVIGEYPTKIGYPGLPAVYDGQGQVCFVGCHNPLGADPDLSPKLNNPSPAWSLAVSLPEEPTYPDPPPPAWIPVDLPDWMPDPRMDSFYQQLLVAPDVQLAPDPPSPQPAPTSPLLSCTGCHDFQAFLFTNFSRHPNAFAFQGPIDVVTKVKAIRGDCCACHNLMNHTSGIVLLKDPDPDDAYPYNGDPVLTNNLCLSCHDDSDDQSWFSINGTVPQEQAIAPMWSLPSAHAENNRRNLRCLDCHKYHGSAFKSMLIRDQPQLCYMSGCHPEKAVEFDPGNPSHHHVEGVLLGGVPTDVITCCDCHNPHHDTTMQAGHPISDPYSKGALYPVIPLDQATLPIPITLPGILINISVTPFYGINTNAAGVPIVDLFCLECHAPDIFIPPNPPWPGAPNISWEIINKYYDSLYTTSNFFYRHSHAVGSPCSFCHSGGGGGGGVPPSRIINGHYTHLKNASCTYCHDPHGSPGTYQGLALADPIGGTFIGGVFTPSPLVTVEGIQRGHLLKDWILVDSTTVNPLPYSGGYQGRGIYSPTTLSSIDGASSCFVNDPLGGCHTISHIHPKIKVDSICNTSSCHSPFSLLFLRETD